MAGRAKNPAGCKTHPRSWVNTPVVCSAEVAAAGKLAAGVPAGRGPAQGCLHRSVGTAGIRGAEQSVAQADASPGIGWRLMIGRSALELPVVEQRRRLRSGICFCGTHTEQGKAAQLGVGWQRADWTLL